MSKHTSYAVCLKDFEKGIHKTKVLLVCEENVARTYKESWRWSLPGGKCCDSLALHSECCVEMPEETALREFREETGYEGAIIAHEFSEDRETPGAEMPHKKHIFRVEIAGGAPLRKKVFSKETPQWFHLTQIPRGIFWSHKEIIETVVLALLKKQGEKK